MPRSTPWPVRLLGFSGGRCADQGRPKMRVWSIAIGLVALVTAGLVGQSLILVRSEQRLAQQGGSDTAWTVYQVEVELHRLRSAVQDANAVPGSAEAAASMQLRYQLAMSRVGAAPPEVAQDVTRRFAALAPLVDAAVTGHGGGDLLRAIRDLEQPVQRLTQDALQATARTGQQNRDRLAERLGQSHTVTALLGGCVVVLILFLLLGLRSEREQRSRAEALALEMREAAERASGAAKPALPRLRVLVAEDNPTNQMVVRAMLIGLGQTVEIVGDGAQAVDAVRGGEYDLVLMDLQMPDVDGYEATRRIRALDGLAAAIPIVALTANAVAGLEELSLKAGMNGHVAKPVTLAGLADLLTRFSPRRSGAAQFT